MRGCVPGRRAVPACYYWRYMYTCTVGVCGMVWRDGLSASVHVYYCTCMMYIFRSQFGEVCGCGGVHAILPWLGGVGVPC